MRRLAFLIVLCLLLPLSAAPAAGFQIRDIHRNIDRNHWEILFTGRVPEPVAVNIIPLTAGFTGSAQQQFPYWLDALLFVVAILLGVLVPVHVLSRRQYARKSAQIDEQNRQLNDDLLERQRIEQQLAEKNEFLQLVIDSVSDPLLVINTDHRVIKMNRAAREAVPEDLPEANELDCFQVLHASRMPCDGESHPCPLVKVRETGEPVTVIHFHNNLEGRGRIIELKASPLFNPDGSLQAVVEVARDITERLEIEELLSENQKRLHHLAHHDPLTDLPNRLLFEDRLKQALSKARRSGRRVALFFLDLDHFKDINDNLGHDFGDLLLVEIGNRLRGCVRESDTVARMGGDEFLVLLEEVDSFEMVEAMAERICQALAHELTRDTYYQRVSASIGISLFPDDGRNGVDLLRNADLAMYRAKNQGKATYQFFSAPQNASLFDNLSP